MWRGLGREGLLPNRSAFLPERAARMLAQIILLDIFLGTPNPDKLSDTGVTTSVRLIGSRLRELADMDVTGQDYLDFVPDREYQSAYLRCCEEKPCGSWSVSPVVYERGYNSLIEITHFPMTDEKTGAHFRLIMIEEMGAELPEFRTLGKPVELKPAIAKHFIDIGAGVPEWPQ
jgi:hypothetical protein